jgi:hypothetical protein
MGNQLNMLGVWVGGCVLRVTSDHAASKQTGQHNRASWCENLFGEWQREGLLASPGFTAGLLLLLLLHHTTESLLATPTLVYHCNFKLHTTAKPTPTFVEH